ncbi:tyrosine-type recombinase/integrase [Nonomuraea sp. NPDC049758]|uniref:tyrosine-type recombinase/integrase n=1 Tax=Nonomuraea sp. NPDC049758 TaxID=3154360 RepID=UPI003448ED3F
MASLIKKCECADTKAGRRLDLRKADDRKTAERVWGKCGHSWTVRYRLGGRGTKQTEASYPHTMKKDAEEFARRVESSKVSHLKLTVDRKAGAVPFGDFAETWYADLNGKPLTKDKYRTYLSKHIKPAIGGIRLDGIEASHIEGLRDKLIAAGYAPSTVRGVLSVVKQVLARAVKDKKITATPYVGIKPPKKAPRKERVVATWEQVMLLVEAMPEHLRLASLIMGYTGARIGEVLGLTTACLTDDANVLIFTGSYTRKHGGQRGSLKHRQDGEDRPVPLPGFLRTAIENHITDHQIPEGGYLFPGKKAKVINDDTYRKRFKAALQKAGLPADFRTHDLRHSFTSNRLADGVALTDVALMVGHSDFRTTANYTHRVKDRWAEHAKSMEATYAAATNP